MNNRPMIMTNKEYLESCDANFLGGVQYTCERALNVINTPKVTKKDIEKELLAIRDEAEKLRRNYYKVK